MSSPSHVEGSEDDTTGPRSVLVPLSDSPTARQTVDAALALLGEVEGPTVCHLAVAIPYEDAVPEGERQLVQAREILERAIQWVAETETDIQVETALLARDRYLYGPWDYATVFEEYVTTADIDMVLLDPGYNPGPATPLLRSLEAELDEMGVAWEEAAIERPAEHEQLIGTASFDRLFALFWISLGFYLVLGDPTYWFDLVTGVAVAAIVSVSLSHVTFGLPPGRVESPVRTIRFGLFVPYLMVEIIRANVAISYVILRPSMPIQPQLTRVNARVGSGLPLLALANSITLTPGTLTVRANDQRLVVHTLLPSAQADLFSGRLERAVRFVFYGRSAARIPTPLERGDAGVMERDEL